MFICKLLVKVKLPELGRTRISLFMLFLRQVLLMVAVVFLAGVQLCILGVMGEYLGRLYEQAKERPLYIVRRASGPAAPASHVG